MGLDMAPMNRRDIPGYLLADPVAPEMTWEMGSLGSTVLALQGGNPEVLEKMADCYAERFRKGWRDLREGIAVFMAPSYVHERESRASGGLVESLGAAMGLVVVALASTTVRGRAEGRRGDPDESFYVGAKAERLLAMERSGVDDAEIEAWVGRTPVDLVVEVEHTHYDGAKRGIYRDAGVAELWEIATPRSGKEAVIIDLQAIGRASVIESSEVVPGVWADGLVDALRLLRELGGYGEFMRAVERADPVVEQLLSAARTGEADRETGQEGP